jgi:hypothetical protein
MGSSDHQVRLRTSRAGNVTTKLELDGVTAGY